jgi:hypothetical protein
MRPRWQAFWVERRMDHGMASPPLDVHRREATPMVSPRPEGSHAPWRPTAAKSVDAWPGRRRAATPQRRAFDSPRARAAQAPERTLYLCLWAGPAATSAHYLIIVRGTAGGDGDETPCFQSEPKPGRGPLGLPFHHAAVLGVRCGNVGARKAQPLRPLGRRSVACALGKGGGRTRTRTWDPLIKSQLLYQLSYAPEPLKFLAARVAGRQAYSTRPPVCEPSR